MRGHLYKHSTAVSLILLALVALTGCQQEMAEQPYYRPLQRSDFFPDTRASRDPVQGTVARGQLQLDRAFYTGLDPARAPAALLQASLGPQSDTQLSVARTDLAERPYLKRIPAPLDKDLPALLRRGQVRYKVYCEVCHDPLGTGNGITVQRGFTPPPTYHSDRLREAPLGYFFDVISRGYGSMADYAAQVPTEDRWAIAAYLRALQLSQHAPVDDLPEPQRKEILSHLESARAKP